MALELFSCDVDRSPVSVEIDGRRYSGNIEPLKTEQGLMVIFRCWLTRREWLLSTDEIRTIEPHPKSERS